PLYADIWLKKDKINFISDNRYIVYPSSIYGLGGRTDPNKAHTINFRGVKLHDKILFSFAKNWYVGTGIYYDQFWDITVLDPIIHFVRQPINKKTRKITQAIVSTVFLLYLIYSSIMST
ncbi:MAG: hypothetical protein EBY22_17290, partial [Gammaproteobacteria bacterium]|nr:hypothetical protein [Gammaproteobacteria bacterium]